MSMSEVANALNCILGSAPSTGVAVRYSMSVSTPTVLFCAVNNGKTSIISEFKFSDLNFVFTVKSLLGFSKSIPIRPVTGSRCNSAVLDAVFLKFKFGLPAPP